MAGDDLLLAFGIHSSGRCEIGRYYVRRALLLSNLGTVKKIQTMKKARRERQGLDTVSGCDSLSTFSGVVYGIQDTPLYVHCGRLLLGRMLL